MTDVWRSWGPVIIWSLAGVPVAAVSCWALAAVLVRRGRSPRAAVRTAIAGTGAVAGTAPWIWMILTPTAGPGGVELTPLRGLGQQLAEPTTALVQIGGNLLVCAALGFFLPIGWRLRPPAVLALAATCSILVEALQYLLALGRVSSVDDVLLNTAGAGFAALASRRWWRVAPGDDLGDDPCRARDV